MVSMKIFALAIISTFALAMSIHLINDDSSGVNIQNVSETNSSGIPYIVDAETVSTQSVAVDLRETSYQYGEPKRSYKGLSSDEYIKILEAMNVEFQFLKDGETMNLDKYTELRSALMDLLKDIGPALTSSPAVRKLVNPVLSKTTKSYMDLDTWILRVCSQYEDLFGYCMLFSPRTYLNKARLLKNILSELSKMSINMKGVYITLKDHSSGEFQSPDHSGGAIHSHYDSKNYMNLQDYSKAAIKEIFHSTKELLDELSKTSTKLWIGGDQNAAIKELKSAITEGEKVQMLLGL